MDALGICFIAIAFIIVIFSNYIFLKNPKRIKKRTIHILIYFLMSLILPFLVFLCFAILRELISVEIFKFKIEDDNYLIRILFAAITFPSSILVNLYFSKFYLKQISKTKNKNEIELIGTE